MFQAIVKGEGCFELRECCDFVTDQLQSGRGRAKNRARVELLVKWVGYNDPTWEPEDSCANCRALVDDYFRNKSTLPSAHGNVNTANGADAYACGVGGVQESPSSPDSDSSDSSTLPVVCYSGYKWCRCPHHGPRMVRDADIDNDRFCCKLGCHAHTKDVRNLDAPDALIVWVKVD